MANKGKLWPQLKKEMKEADCPDGQIEYARQIVHDYNPNYTREYNLGEAFRNSNASELGLENQSFNELKDSVFDRTEQMSESALSDKQLDQLGDAEREEVIKQEIDMRKSRKTNDNDRIKHLQDYAVDKGIKLEDKITKERPPQEFQGQSETYDALEELSKYHYILGDMFLDLRKQVFEFKPTTETQKKALPQLEKYIAEELLPFAKVAIAVAQGAETTLRNITDEKYGQTASGWMKIASDKFLESGNHGSGEVNAVSTGKWIMKLKDDCVVRTPVKREFTREEVGDKTVFEMEGQLNIKCPSCEFEFNKPIVSDEQRDLIAGDLFEQAKKVLMKDGLSNFIDYVATNVITEELKTPEQFFIEQCKKKYNKNVTDEELKNLKVIDNKPEKIKAVDIDPESINKLDHSMLNNAARRRHDKSDHFSRVA